MKRSIVDNFDLFELRMPAPAPPSKLVGKIPLRWSQREDVDAMLHAIERGATHPCCVGATGYGKGPIIAEIVGRLRKSNGGKIVCLVDRAHLVHQLANVIERHLEIECGRIADGECVGLRRSVVVSTVQAMYTPDSKGRPLYEYPHFDETKAVMLDESHRFFAPCFRSVADHFAREDATICGFTATPVASNGAVWHSFFNWVAGAEGPCMRTVGWCVAQGYLVRPQQAFVKVDLDLSAIYQKLQTPSEPEASSCEDEDAGDELADVLIAMLRDSQEKKAASFAAGVADVIGQRRAIIFAPTRVSAAKTLASWINATGRIACEPVWGGRVDKKDVLDQFKRGSPQALANVNLLCEGFDEPTVSAIFVCRLLKVWRLAAQMTGRALRPHPSVVDQLNALDDPESGEQRKRVIRESQKPDAIVADLVGTDGKVLQASAIDVLFSHVPEEVRLEMASVMSRRETRWSDDIEQADQAALDEARSRVLEKQHEQLAEMMRRRAMAGDVPADVSVRWQQTSDDDALTPPSIPTPPMEATPGEKAFFVAVAVHYPIEKAMAIAAKFERSKLRGMTHAMRRKLEADGGRPDWQRARSAYPDWSAQR